MESPSAGAEPDIEGFGDSETNRQHDDERFTELEESLQAEFPKVERVVVLPTSLSRDALLLIVLLSWNASRKEPWARRITASCAAKGLTVFPAVYPWRHWNELDRSAFKKDWPDALKSDASALSMVELIKEHGKLPRDLRRMLLGQLKAYQRLVEHLRAYTPVPLYIRLSLCADIHRRALDLLFAWSGKQFDPDDDSIAMFGEEFAKKRPFLQSHVLDYFEMVALSSQASLSHQLGRSRPFRRRSLQLFDTTTSFLKAFRRSAYQELTTPIERRRRRVLKAIGMTLVILLAAAGVAYYFYLTQPEEPIANERVIRRPGGILGHYYRGKGFNKIALKKINSHINFRTRKAFVKGVPTNHFTARWSGYIQFPENESKLLCARYDDGVRLYFNNRLIINDWVAAGARLRCERIRAKKGWYPIKLEFFDTVGWAECRLRWGKARDKLTLVPGKHLCCR